MLDRRLKATGLALTIGLLGQAARADLIAKPYTFVAGQPLQAAQLNADFDTIYNNYNGNITNANVKANAAIAFSKLDFTGQLGPILRAATNPCVSCGTTGDTNARLQLMTSGALRWGPGNAATDTQLFRDGVGLLKLNLVSGGEARFSAAQLEARNVYTDTQPTVEVNGQVPGILFGAGGSSAPDIHVVRETSPATAIAVKDGGGVNYLPIDVSALYINGQLVTPSGYAGSGTEGVVSVNTSSFTGPKRYDATTWTVNSAQLLTINDGALNVNSTGQARFFAGDVSMGASSILNGGLGGGTGSNSLRGAAGGGAGGGAISQYDGAGGNGGSSFLFGGGAGGHNGTSGQAGTETPPSGVFYARTGGGSGGNSIVMTATSNGGLGGSGMFPAVFASITGFQMFSGSDLLSNGGAGAAGAVATTNNAAGGGAGGAGGNVLIADQDSFTGSAGATIALLGGAGGAAGRNSSGNAGGGAGGASGTLVIWTPVYNPNGITITLTGGAGGAGIGTGAAGTAGDNGSLVQITGTPNNPLLVHFLNNPDAYRGYMRSIVQIARATGQDHGQVNIPHNMMCHIASEGDFVKYAKLKTERGLEPMSDSTCLGIGDNSVSDSLKNAS